MKLEDFKGAEEINDDVELETALKKRYGNDANSFWLTHKSQKYPSMAVLVKGNLASVNYFPEEDSAGFRSVGNVDGLTPGEMSIFYLDSENQEQEVLNDSIVPFKDAVKAAKEFLTSSKLPTSIQWFEL